MKSSAVIRGIGHLVTLRGAQKKSGRRPTERDLSVLKNAAMVVSDGRIVWIGTDSKLPRTALVRRGREVHLKGATVIPGLIDCHTHLVFAAHRAAEFEMRMQGESYQAIARKGGGILSTVKATRAASLAELVREAQRRVQNHLRQGVTTVEIKSGYGLNQDDEIKILKAIQRLKNIRRVSTFLGPHALPREFSSTDLYLDHLMDQVLPKLAREQWARRVDMFVERGYFSVAQAQRYFEKAERLGFDLVAHAEQLSRSGTTRLLRSLSFQSMDHLIHLNAADIRALGRSQTTAVLLPASDFYLKMAYPPARRLLSSGARVALATDFNPGSCPSQDVSFVGLLARMEMKMSLAEVLVGFTVSAAFALGLERDLGSLDVGKFADFCVLDGEMSDLFYQVGRSPVKNTWIGGKKIC